MREQMEKEILKTEKWVITVLILVVGSAMYGLFSLIKNLI